MPEMIPVDSSNLAAYSYDEATRELRVKFRSGGMYAYEQVPVEVVDEMKRSSSIGTYFALHIKGQYPTHRVA